MDKLEVIELDGEIKKWRGKQTWEVLPERIEVTGIDLEAELVKHVNREGK
jgi:hypothetical protein